MKIVHVTSSPVRKAAGVREVVMGLARHQRAQGSDVSVLSLEHPDWDGEKGDWDGIPVKLCPVKGPRSLGYSPEMTSKLHSMQPDVVHLHGLWMHPGRSVRQWYSATGKPYVVSPHGMLSKVALSYSPWKKQAASWLFQNAVFQDAAVIHVTSQEEYDEAKDYDLQSEVVIVPNGVSDPSLAYSTGETGRTILSIGRIHKKKALDQLVLAWQSLEDAFPDWSLLIVGPDELGEAAKLKRMVQDAKLKRASILGPIYGEKKLELMASAGIFALPTRSENFALTVAESLMLGVPVVSSQGAPWSGLETEQCGLWVPFGADHMSNALAKLMSISDSERVAMGERGRSWMLRDFSWRSVCNELQKCYETVIERHP